MPASAVAMRTPAIGGRSGMVLGARGETGWDMERGHITSPRMRGEALLLPVDGGGRPLPLGERCYGFFGSGAGAAAAGLSRRSTLAFSRKARIRSCWVLRVK